MRLSVISLQHTFTDVSTIRCFTATARAPSILYGDHEALQPTASQYHLKKYHTLKHDQVCSLIKCSGVI